MKFKIMNCKFQIPITKIQMTETSNFTLSVLNRKIAFSTLTQYVGKIAQMVLAAYTLKLISNFLSENDYGVYAKITEYVLFFSVAANLGIFGNIVRKMSDDPKNGNVFMNSLILRLITGFLFFVTGILIVGNSDKVFFIGSVLFFGALFFDFVTSVCDGALQANYLMGRATFALVSGRIINFILISLFIKKWLVGEGDTSIFYLFIPALTGSLVTAFLSIYFVYKKIEWKFKLDLLFMLEILKTSLPFGIINIINNLYFRFLPDYLASNYSFLSSAEFGSFNIFFRIAQVLSLFSTFLMFSALPGLKEYIKAGHSQKAHILYKRIWQIFLVCGIALVSFGSLLGPYVLEFLTHKKYFLPQFWFVLPLMLVLAAISYFYDLVLITLFALEKDIWFLKRECIALFLSCVVFSGVFLVTGSALKLVMIMGGAIVGEGVIVILGLNKIKKLL